MAKPAGEFVKAVLVLNFPFPFWNQPPQIPELVVDLTTLWPHHIYKGCTGNGSCRPNSFVFRIFRVSPFNSKIWPPSPRIGNYILDARKERA